MCIFSAIEESPASLGLKLPLFFSPSLSPLCVFLWLILTSPVLCCLPLVELFKVRRALWRRERLWNYELKDNTAKWRKLRSNSFKAGIISSDTANPIKHCQKFNWISFFCSTNSISNHLIVALCNICRKLPDHPKETCTLLADLETYNWFKWQSSLSKMFFRDNFSNFTK